jgi:hypothetical protein
MTWLDDTLATAKREGVTYVPGPKLNRLQPWVVEDGRLLTRVKLRVTVVESAFVAGVNERVCFVLFDPRWKRRVALDLIPDAVDEQLSARDRVHAILAGGDVDALITFRGKDIVRNLTDCMCLFARLEPNLFTNEGWDHAHVEANPGARYAELNRRGTTFVRVPWMTADGDDRMRSVRVVRRTRFLPRPARALAA